MAKNGAKPRPRERSRFAATKAQGGSFHGVIREDGRWHRLAPGLLGRYGIRGHEYRQVGVVRWLLRWGGR